jgi:flagellar hook-associated protein 3 FlgL
MRVTENVISYNYLDNVNQAREHIVQLQSQMASGKRVQKPSDDPRASNAIMRLQQALLLNDQYSKNVEDGISMADATSAALDSFGQLYQDMKVTIVQATNGGNSTAMSTYAQNIDDLLSQAIDVANSKFNGKYLFGGTQTLDPPYTLSADRETVTKNPNGINGVITYPVSDGLNQQVNIPGEVAFQGTGIIGLMIQVRDSLRNGQVPTTAQSDAVNAAYEQVLLQASKAGSFVSSLETVTSSLQEQNTRLQQFLSTEQDADLAESIMKLKQQEAALDAAIQTGAQIMPKTLLDFLR